MLCKRGFTIVVFATLVELLNCENGYANRVECTDKEIQKTGCINGKCYILKLDGYREASCHCHQDYAGSRCQELNIELLFESREKYASSNVYIIVGVIVLVVLLALIIFIICYRRVKGLPISDVFSNQIPDHHLIPNEEGKIDDISSREHRTLSGKKLPSSLNKMSREVVVSDMGRIGDRSELHRLNGGKNTDTWIAMNSQPDNKHRPS